VIDFQVSFAWGRKQNFIHVFFELQWVQVLKDLEGKIVRSNTCTWTYAVTNIACPRPVLPLSIAKWPFP
jgi:hypothetical protein